jgi:crotonobetainyl-CoA:carnitine CoA-transferase CaiB-like acyl-CoA transferase
MSNVMEGIRILEVAEHTFVPASSGILSDGGAEVIKIEHHERGDALRGLASTGLVGLDGPLAVLMEHSNGGKKSLGLNLAGPAGLEILHKLIAISDVFLTNKMAGVRKRLHLDVKDVRPQPEHYLRARRGVRQPRPRRRRRRRWLRFPRGLVARRGRVLRHSRRPGAAG